MSEDTVHRAHDSIGWFTGEKKIFFLIDCTVELHIVKGIQKYLWCAFMFITQLFRSRDCNPGSKRKQLYPVPGTLNTSNVGLQYMCVLESL